MPDYVGSPTGPRTWSELPPIRFRTRGRLIEDEFALRVEDSPERGPVVTLDGGPRRWRKETR